MIHFVIGTRAQLFKMIPIMLECEERNLQWRWIYTAQHKDTIDNTLKTFGIKPADYILFYWNSEAKTMSKMWYWFIKSLLQLIHTRKILANYTGKNSIVLTHGDTLTTWWGALLGRVGGCKVMHVESGLRSFKLLKPFPEEINRLITFRLANIYACPGDWALNNLKKYKGEKINTGENTQIDMLRLGYERADKSSLKLPKLKYVVVSLHRYENIFNDDRFSEIIERTKEIAEKFPIYWVQHPATKERLKSRPELLHKLKSNPNITLLPRLEYLDFIKLVKHSEFVVTDGGGNQEELYHMGKPTLIFRNETERKEGLGETAVISKLSPEIINKFINEYKKYSFPAFRSTAEPSKIIVKSIEKYGR